MRSRRIQMTLEEYEMLPFQLGWKCEYVAGYAHFTPRHQPVITAIKVEPQQVSCPFQIRPASISDVDALIQPYALAFGETIEYCDCNQQQIEKAARDALQSHFANARGEHHTASKVVFEKGNGKSSEVMIGAALLVTGEFGAMLDLLFVTPKYQRHGVASALIASAVNELYRLGHTSLTSRYHIGNEQSRDWHRRFGFVELPDLAVAQIYARAAQHELRRLEKLGELTAQDHARLKGECEHWRKRVKELEKIEAEQGYEAVHPNLRWW